MVLSCTYVCYSKFLIDIKKFYIFSSEIEELQQKVLAERKKYDESGKKETAVTALPCFSMNGRFELNRDDASYTLNIEVQSPIDIVLLQVFMYFFYLHGLYRP